MRIQNVFKQFGILLILSFLFAKTSPAQDSNQIKIFGYFQNTLQAWSKYTHAPAHSTFNTQQLNIFFQKDLNRSWTAFINIEFLNNFSSQKHWGSLNLEEVWVRYHYDYNFNLKLGLLTPVFNNLNEIKNKTPVLPYIIRPLSYETSFNEFIPVEVLTPTQAYAQAYGFIRLNSLKLDYAFYVGNSPNINDKQGNGQTGTDTTFAFLYGGRVGMRFNRLKMGVSGSYDKDDLFQGEALVNMPDNVNFRQIPKTRIGADLSYDYDDFSFEGELINVDMEKNSSLSADLNFYYATLGYHIADGLFSYATYWFLEEDLTLNVPVAYEKEYEEISVYSFGLSQRLLDELVLKVQFARVESDQTVNIFNENLVFKNHDNFNIFALAVSVIF
ncbi:MAG: hypothetical protein H6627_09320 [Calditrichae bacterium]|nr:hypothetical protein [Calditrichota bacterium]MCB9058755.1 hypothetical protein [Calditrichia bacterium]